jgi:integrase
LRYTELFQLDTEATEPTHTGWRFVVQLKGQDDYTEIFVPRLKEQALCPVLHLEVYRDLLRVERAEHGQSSTSFWVRPDGQLMKVPEIREQGKRIMQAAGTRSARGYMLKHMFMTALREAGMLAEDLAEYGRHKAGSSTFRRYVDWSGSLEAGMKKVLRLK